jgi:hypothetical protein
MILSTALIGCASGPETKVSDSPASVAAVAPEEAAATTARAAEKAAPGTAADTEFVPPAGYQRKKRGATTVYCRSDTPVGTRFAKEYCYTQADLERLEANRTNVRQDVDRARRTCTGGGCGGG